MSIPSISGSGAFLSSLLLTQKNQLDEKTIQFTTGKVSQTYAGLGEERITSLKMQQEVTVANAHLEAATNAGLQIEQLGKTLEQMEKLRSDAVTAINPNNYQLTTEGETTSQATTRIMTLETISQLNTNVGGYYLYGGKNAVDAPVASFEKIMDGTAGKIGLKQMMASYEDAHLGADGSGRTTVSSDVSGAAARATVAQNSTGPFGYQIVGANSFGSGFATAFSAADLTDPMAPVPAKASVDVTGTVKAGDFVAFDVALPNGKRTTVKLEAADGRANGYGSFAISKAADPLQARKETAQNIADLLEKTLKQVGATELKAAADSQAGDEFFGLYDKSRSPQEPRLPKADASGYEAAGSKVMPWYTGYDGPGTPRSDKEVHVDKHLTVQFGARANEEPFARQLKNLSVFVAADFTADVEGDKGSEARAEQYYNALASETDRNLSVAESKISGVRSVATEISVARTTIQSAETRLKQRTQSYLNLQQKIENVDKMEVAVQLSEMLNNLQASYKMTSSILNLNLHNYLRS
ncbi:hypothetical protein [Polycladidibacter hongkongensis]|uniref:hypothetical protein n=1 Tax=Polycladidibacter hongkongensis TaxID=1647556 RepID=UPI00082F469A|nr:hypothetical protein [Pseudovibrio hongkongensis]